MKTDLSYERLNFNTFSNAVIFLFTIALNNDWPILANICVINNGTSNRRMMKFFFVIFKLFMNYIFLNSVIAFMVEVFSEYARKRELKALRKKDLIKENATIYYE